MFSLTQSKADFEPNRKFLTTKSSILNEITNFSSAKHSRCMLVTKERLWPDYEGLLQQSAVVVTVRVMFGRK